MDYGSAQEHYMDDKITKLQDRLAAVQLENKMLKKTLSEWGTVLIMDGHLSINDYRKACGLDSVQ